MVFGEFMSGENFNDTGVRHLSGFFWLWDGGGSPGARCEQQPAPRHPWQCTLILVDCSLG